MEIKITHKEPQGTWSCHINGKQITEQSSLFKLFKKMMKYTKSQKI
ncbi:MAG: hypothetical protein L3I99_05595 [Sulfurimonas sp.]|nr:hypothetical protein [Sulfurimonas sp.]